MNVDLKEIRWKGVDWFNLAHDRDRWWTGINAAMKFGFHKMRGIFLTVRLRKKLMDKKSVCCYSP